MSKAEVGALLGVSGKVVLSTHVECPKPQRVGLVWKDLDRLWAAGMEDSCGLR